MFRFKNKFFKQLTIQIGTYELCGQGGEVIRWGHKKNYLEKWAYSIMCQHYYNNNLSEYFFKTFFIQLFIFSILLF